MDFTYQNTTNFDLNLFVEHMDEIRNLSFEDKSFVESSDISSNENDFEPQNSNKDLEKLNKKILIYF